jgi:multidrug transporter EmrE-like cation transporter
MNAVTFTLILTGVLLNAAAQLLLKAGTNVLGAIGLVPGQIVATFISVALQPYILGGLACYVFSVAIWIVALSRVDVSIAYPMLSIGYVVNAIAAWHLFGESLTASRLLGIAVIIMGVVIISRS